MLIFTHLAFSLIFFLIFLKNQSFIPILIFFISTILPDLDSANSLISRKTTKIFSRIFRHRGFLHSFTALILFSFIIFFIYKLFLIYFILGYFLHLFLDSLNPKGIKVLWPLNFKIQWKIKTGSVIEIFVLIILIFINIILIIKTF